MTTYLKHKITNEITEQQENYFQLGKSIREEYVKASKEEVNSYNLEKTKNNKLEELETYHNSDTTRKATINGHVILNNSDFRSLIDEQKDRFKEKLDLSLAQESELIFNYRYNGSGIIPITYQQLRLISVSLKDLADQNFQVKQKHRENILSFNDYKELKKLSSYNYKEGFILDQSFNI